MSEFITLDEAIQMTGRYRDQKGNILKPEYEKSEILAISETFQKASVDAVINQEGCAGMRIYFGMSEDLNIHSILIGVNDQGEDLLPVAGAKMAMGESVLSSPPIIENAQRCPPTCSFTSPLNS